ncbi:MAG: diguanylate cyclase [Clostridia bacterium]|nr:diguanylate cyclase [Clostridia bacterium]
MIEGKGYIVGILKTLQSALRNLIWQTKAISFGDFSQTESFLGEFSEAFNHMVNKLEAAILELEEAKDLCEMLFETIPDATMIISMETGMLLNCNRAFEIMMGYSKSELCYKRLNELHFFKDSEQERVFFNSIHVDTTSNNILIELRLWDETQVYGLLSSNVVTIKNERYILSVIKDITEMKKLEQNLKESEERHRLLADNASDVIWTMDLNRKFTYISPSVEKLRGYTVEEVFAQPKEELLCPSSRGFLENWMQNAVHLVENNLPFDIFRGDVEQPCKDGTTVWIDLTMSGIYDKENRFIGILGVSKDITERKRMEEEITRVSETDRLTQLNNRSKLDAILNLELERLPRSESVCSVIILDLDFFKRVNDTWGHLMGDAVLKEVAQILRDGIRPIDTVGRWGGEEFMVVMPLSDLSEGIILAEKLRARIAEHSFLMVGHITASFGVAQTRGSLSAVELVAKADAGLYEAKNSGRNRVCYIQLEDATE